MHLRSRARVDGPVVDHSFDLELGCLFLPIKTQVSQTKLSTQKESLSFCSLIGLPASAYDTETPVLGRTRHMVSHFRGRKRPVQAFLAPQSNACGCRHHSGTALHPTPFVDGNNCKWCSCSLPLRATHVATNATPEPLFIQQFLITS